MKYLELKLKTPSENIEMLISKIMDLGIDSFEIHNPKEIEDIIKNLDDTEWYDKEQVSQDFIKEETEEDLASVILYFPDDESNESFDEELCEGRTLANQVIDAVTEIPEVTWELEEKDDSQWKDNWKEYFFPTQVTERILVAPTWAKEEDIPESEFVIRIDPGMAFGTGTHETTALTMRLMERVLSKFPGTSKLLDVGTGSGILSIAAAYLGATDILAIDIDREAVEVAKENIKLNLSVNNYDVDESECTGDNSEVIRTNNAKITVREGDLTKGVDYKADIVVANLLTDLVIRFTPDAAKHLNPGGIFISSGILVEHKDRVIKALGLAGFDVDNAEILDEGEWSAISVVLKK